MTANVTQAGHASQSTRATRDRQTEAMTIPTMSASIAWRLGIAAYGFEAKAISPLSWVTAADSASVSVKPHSGNIRGGAVGIRT